MGKTVVTVIVIVIVVRILRAVYRWISRSSRKPNPTKQGIVGENKVSSILGSLPKNYHVLNNVIVPNQQGTSQIDHVVISPFGIFVIETKNYSGFVSGTENSETWCEAFRTTGGNSFRNPIKQNWGHIYALSDYLNYDKRVFRPIIVFSDSATLRVETSTPVIYMSQLKETILSYNQQIIPPEQIEQIYNRISKANLVGTEIGDKHTQTVKEAVAKQEEALRQGKCPKCGGDLVLRSGKYGEFYGCTNYPKCKYTNSLRG